MIKEWRTSDAQRKTEGRNIRLGWAELWDEACTTPLRTELKSESAWWWPGNRLRFPRSHCTLTLERAAEGSLDADHWPALFIHLAWWMLILQNELNTFFCDSFLLNSFPVILFTVLSKRQTALGPRNQGESLQGWEPRPGNMGNKSIAYCKCLTPNNQSATLDYNELLWFVKMDARVTITSGDKTAKSSA